ncbi:hypothetical protein [Photobacterium chitinilyticum]|nr:hypothetical protein [Photobacterium chitinilyticum]
MPSLIIRFTRNQAMNIAQSSNQHIDSAKQATSRSAVAGWCSQLRNGSQQ